MSFPEKKYSIIYADPPWRYGGGKGKNSSKWGNSLSVYPCMKLEQLKALQVGKLADENCALFLWATHPMLPEAIELMGSWGFTFKTTAFVWNKVYGSGKKYCGMGYWTRSGSEICLLGFRGRMERKSKKVYQVLDAEVKRHSEKPEIVRDRIIELMGNLPRIELFARKYADGWDSWGNELAALRAEGKKGGE